MLPIQNFINQEKKNDTSTFRTQPNKNTILIQKGKKKKMSKFKVSLSNIENREKRYVKNLLQTKIKMRL